MRSRRRNAQLGAQGAEGAGGGAPAPERENVQPAPGLELIGQEMVVKPPGNGKGSRDPPLRRPEFLPGSSLLLDVGAEDGRSQRP